MKSLIFVSTIFFSTLTLAAGGITSGGDEAAKPYKLSCYNPDIQDSQLSATFSFLGEDASVTLFVPAGETSGQTFEATCKADSGAIELAYTCNVMTSTDSGWEVKLFSIGGSKLKASFQPWNMQGKGEVTSVSCQ